MNAVGRAVLKSLVALAAAVALFGCGGTATVIDRSDTKTVLRRIRLEGEGNLKVLLGGALRSIPLEEIRMIKMDPSESIVYDREMYYAAQVILRDGSVLSESGVVSSYQRQCYCCIRNILAGSKRRGERYRIPLDKIVQIKVE